MTDHESTEALSSARSVQLMRKMSHDMRAPMASIIGTADLLLTGGCDELTPRQTRATERIRRNGVRLVAILDDLITYVKAEAGEYILEAAPFDPCVLLTRALAEVQPAAAERGLRCKTAVAENVPACLVGDEPALHRILLALLWNAVSFTSFGSVNVESTWADKEWSVLVKDTGPGITPDMVAKLFEPFGRGEERPQVPTAGCGLGLAMARALARAMHGDLTLAVTSSRGSTFHLRLPLPIG